MTDTALNLDRLAAQRAQEMVLKVRVEAEKQAQKQGKTVEETAKAKKALAKKRTETLERLATKSLGVLQEQGVYAMMLFLFSRTSDEQKVAPVVRRELYNALRSVPGLNGNEIRDSAQDALQFYTDSVLADLNTLLLVRDLYEQTLIYARYGAKAAGG